MRRVLVTGGAGTIGAAVVRRLLAEPDLEVRVSDQRDAPAWMSSACEIHTADLREVGNARDAIAGCDGVVHLAAIVGGIANFHKLPYTLSEVNADLYTAIFHVALEQDLERFLYVSSSMVFERATEFPTTEEHVDVCPDAAVGLRLLEAHGRGVHGRRARGARTPVHDLQAVQRLRAGEIPDDEPGIAHLVPDLIKKVLSGQARLRSSDPASRRGR